MKKGSSSSRKRSSSRNRSKSRPELPKPGVMKPLRDFRPDGPRFCEVTRATFYRPGLDPCFRLGELGQVFEEELGQVVEEEVEVKVEGSDGKMLTCNVCDRSFDTSRGLRRHYCPSPTPSSCSSSSEDEVKKSKKSICSICGDSFKSMRSFAYHQRYCLPRGEDEEDVVDEPWLDGERFEYFARRFADASLLYLKSTKSLEYKLVKPGPYQSANISMGPIVHLNFRAKPKDCPEAEVHTFFAQLRMYPPRQPFQVDCCVSLGADVPHFTEANTYGCTYCQHAVHHPGPTMECPKLFTGANPKDSYWLYGSSDSSDDGGDEDCSSDQ